MNEVDRVLEELRVAQEQERAQFKEEIKQLDKEVRNLLGATMKPQRPDKLVPARLLDAVYQETADHPSEVIVESGPSGRRQRWPYVPKSPFSQSYTRTRSRYFEDSKGDGIVAAQRDDFGTVTVYKPICDADIPAFSEWLQWGVAKRFTV